MAVLVEGISVIILRAAIASVYPGGWQHFAEDCPNETLCADAHLARIGFMHPQAVQEFVERLEDFGFEYLVDGEAHDLVVVDQLTGPTTTCRWIEVGRVESGDSEVRAARRTGDQDRTLITPIGWKFEESLSAAPGFVATDEVNDRVEFLRSEDGVDIYRDRDTGKILYTPSSNR